MFTENISVNILKYVSVCSVYKIFIEIFGWTFQSVAGKDKLGKYSSKYFDKYLRNLTYSVILKVLTENILVNILKYDSVC